MLLVVKLGAELHQQASFCAVNERGGEGIERYGRHWTITQLE